MGNTYMLAIDQGTSSTKSTIFDTTGNAIAKGQVELFTHFLDDGYVEQDPEAIYENMLASVSECLAHFRRSGGLDSEIVTIGISNQRETFIVWDETGTPLHQAVVWQCKRSIAICNRLLEEGLKETIKERTGLIVDPYFSGSKLIWLYEHDMKVKTAIDEGRAYFGTVDTWLLFKLSDGKIYRTDHTNASRTLFFNLRTLQWDQSLLATFGLSKLKLPSIHPSSFDFGQSNFNGLFDREIPIQAMIGDSHAAAFGEGCFEKGQAKATLGTGCSILMNAGQDCPSSSEGIVSTICWSTATRVDYALEGVIVSCGSTIEWLRRELGLFSDSKDTEAMAMSVEDNNGVYIVPAFSGLGAPYWDMRRKGEIHGLTFSCTKNHMVRAGLETIPYQIRDVIDSMKQGVDLELRSIAINGGITKNEFVLHFLADLVAKELSLGTPDASGLGAALLAGLNAGLYRDLEHLKASLTLKTTIKPNLANHQVQDSFQKWLQYMNCEVRS